MSYAMPGQPVPTPAHRTRPGTVTAATWLLLLVAVLHVLSSLAMFTQVGAMSDALRDVYAGYDMEGAETFGVLGTVIAGVVNVLFAAGFVVLAVFNNQGSNPSRIVTWVIGGLALCCTGVGLLGQAALGSMQFGGDVGPGPAEVQQALDAALPGWYNALTWVAGVGSVLALLAAIILLAMPASNEYFRKPLPPVEPPPPYPRPGV